MNRAHPAVAAVALVPVTITVFVASCASMIQREELVTVQTLAPSAHACGECHVAIHDEWGRSAHARAFTDGTFLKATLGARTESCLGCHVPDSVLHLAEEPLARTHSLDEGVTCIACHLDQKSHAMVGPLRNLGPIVPHAVLEGDEWFRSGALCATCHVGTARETQTWASVVGDPRTCQECHMPEVDRRTTQATDLVSAGIVALHETYPSRSHTFELGAIADFPDAVAIEATVSNTTSREVTVTATNLLPHAIPTGDFGHREVTLLATLFDGEGEMLNRGERRFTNREGSPMEPGLTESLSLLVSSELSGGSLQVELTRVSSAEQDTITVARAEFRFRGRAVNSLPEGKEMSP